MLTCQLSTCRKDLKTQNKYKKHNYKKKNTSNTQYMYMIYTV